MVYRVVYLSRIFGVRGFLKIINYTYSMKNFFLIVCTASLTCLMSCNKSFEVKTDFSFNNPNVKIVDTLPVVRNKVAHIAILYGQSNADGQSYDQYLKANDINKFNEYDIGYENVLINFFNDGGNNSSNFAFQKTRFGCGCATFTYGPELGMADKMSKAYSDQQVFIIKWTWGGTALRNQWLDGSRNRGELYNLAMDFTIKNLNYLLSKGYELDINGICWMQGESDAYLKDCNIYYKDTVAFVSYLRHDLKNFSEAIRFIDAGINEEPGIWENSIGINNAKKDFARLSDLNIFIDTNAMGLTTKFEPAENPDLAHYDSLSMVKLGQAFGNALIGE